MPRPRKSLISLEATSYYHCISRCVRRAFLCGEDALTGRSFEHRRGWIEERLLKLAQIFGIEVCGYSIMASHTHLVLHVDQPLADSWSTREVVERWHQLFGGTICRSGIFERTSCSKWRRHSWRVWSKPGASGSTR